MFDANSLVRGCNNENVMKNLAIKISVVREGAPVSHNVKQTVKPIAV